MDNADGKIVIGTGLDTSGLDKGIKDAEKRLQELENKMTKKGGGGNVSLDISLLTDEEQKEYDELFAKNQKLQEKKYDLITVEKQIANETEKTASATEKQISKTQSEIDKAMELKQQIEEILNDIKDTERYNVIDNNDIKFIEEAKIKINELSKEYKKLTGQKLEIKGITDVEKNTKTVNMNMSGVLKKVAKWGLAIFSVRSAYALVSQAVSTVSQYNEQVGTDIEYIRYAIAMTLQPVIEGIIKLVYKLLTYIGYIAKAWFGVDLWAKSSANNFANAKDNVSGISKEAQKLQKQLTGFDEMNILQENGDISSGGGGGGITAPSVDLGDWNKVKVPEWIDRIAKNKDLIIGFFVTLGTVIGAIKLAKLLDGFGLLQPLLSGVLTLFQGLSALQIVGVIGGITLAIIGVVDTIKSVIEFIKDPSWENFDKILGGLTITLLGVALAMIAFNATNPVGWIVLATGAVAGLVTGVVGLIGQLIEDKAHILDTKEAQEQLTAAINNTREATENYANYLDEYDNAVKKAEEAAKTLEEAQKKNGITVDELKEKVENEGLTYDKMTDSQKEVWKAYYNNETAQNDLKTSTENLTTGYDNLIEAQETEKDKSWELELSNAKQSESYDKLKEKIIEAYEQGELSAEEARDYIERATSEMSTANSDAFTKDIPKAIKDGLDVKHYQSSFTKLKNGFNEVWDSVKTGASNAWNGVKSFFGFSSGGVFGFAKGGVVGFAKGGIAKPIKCARGSIISQPGRGVPITRAIGGEHGAEGIIPLTDSQMMAQLGEMIGRYVNINLTNITKLDSRQIARTQNQINAQNDFVLNR